MESYSDSEDSASAMVAPTGIDIKILDEFKKLRAEHAAEIDDLNYKIDSHAAEINSLHVNVSLLNQQVNSGQCYNY